MVRRVYVMVMLIVVFSHTIQLISLVINTIFTITIIIAGNGINMQFLLPFTTNVVLIVIYNV